MATPPHAHGSCRVIAGQFFFSSGGRAVSRAEKKSIVLLMSGIHVKFVSITSVINL